MTTTLTSNYSELINDYISFKRNLGYELSNQYHWMDIDRFLQSTEEKGAELGITGKQFQGWYRRRPNETLRNQYERACRLRNFSAYLKLLGYDSYQPGYLKMPAKMFTPYIFSKEEIKRVFDAADSISSKNAAGSIELSSVMFRLLYSTGLRVGELTALKLDDIAIYEKIPYLKISNTKTNQDRLVALSSSSSKALQWYLNIRPSSELEEVFLDFKKHPITQGTVYHWFRQLLYKAGIPHLGKGRGPRVQDVRHTFAVHSLHEMHGRGMDLYCSLPILSKFLGHVCISSTDSYVRLTSEMYPEVLETMSEVSRLVFPEVFDEA
jgi:integrase/recombinase XerD